MNIILCGLPMSGKTTLGRLLSQHLNWPFIDTDRLIEEAYKNTTGHFSSCRQIFLEEGETKFRQLENEQLRLLSPHVNAVIATGGGSLINKQNTEILKELGRLIYLKSPLELIWKRVAINGIPAYLNTQNPEKHFYEIAYDRIKNYELAADITIETEFLTKFELIEAALRRLSYLPLD